MNPDEPVEPRAPRYDYIREDETSSPSQAPPKSAARPVDPAQNPSLANWVEPADEHVQRMGHDVAIQCGWGRLIFGHTFDSPAKLAHCLCQEVPGHRDVALYLRDPHVVLAQAPERLFLDPSHTFRLDLAREVPESTTGAGFSLRLLDKQTDPEGINRLFGLHNMVPVDAGFLWEHRSSPLLTYVVAEDDESEEIVGTVTGVDHVAAFSDLEGGSSLWTLAVDPQAPHPGIGKALVRFLAEHFRMRGRNYMDLSVLADNAGAISLYERLGFYRVPVFCLKHKHNPINEPLYTPPKLHPKLNPYAAIIVSEARRRGIAVEVLDEELGYFALTFGGRSVVCRESLTELTSAIAMSRCADKRVTLALCEKQGLRVPQHHVATGTEADEQFLRRMARIVVKPVDGEQGRGISVDIQHFQDLAAAVERAKTVCDHVMLEEFVTGSDLRVIVIDRHVVAAALRKPPMIMGTGSHTIEELIEKQSRRRAAATGGESSIPRDAETLRCIASAGYGLKDVLVEGVTLVVRKTANLHTGGTIHDVTPEVHPAVAEASVTAARALDIPVVGLDFIVPAADSPDYVLIEANERPGLANHEPAPTAERFVDFLFPNSAVGSR